MFQVTEYVGVDIEISGHDNAESTVDVYYDGKVLPFEDESFDSLLSSEVLPEHEVPYDYGRYTSYGIQHLLRSHGFEIVSITKTVHFVEVLWQHL